MRPVGMSASGYIADYLDPSGALQGDEDAQQVLAEMDAVFAHEGGAQVSLAEMEAYLQALRTAALEV